MGACLAAHAAQAPEPSGLEPQPTLLEGTSRSEGKRQSPSGQGGEAEEEEERPLVQFARRASQVDCSKPRLLLVSDNLPLFELLIRAAKGSTVVVPVQYATWSLEDLSAAVRLRAGQPRRQFTSVGLLDHGAPGAFCFLKSIGDGWVDLDKIAASPELQECFRLLASYVEAPQDPAKFRENLAARVDLMNCSVYAGAGRDLLEYLEGLTSVNWAASTNETGHGSDWILESDAGLGDVAASYFCEAELKRWRFTARADMHCELLRKYPMATSEAYIDGVRAHPGAKRHVVLSTKYKEPWFGLSVKAKLALLKDDYTVYNPNTDNAEAYGCEADDRWLRTFGENLTLVEKTQGFVLQVQQGLEGQKTHMQVAEEMLGEKWQVPRLSVWAFDKPGGFDDPERFPLMVQRAGELFREINLYAEPDFKDLGIQNLESEKSDGFYDGPFDTEGRKHGIGAFRSKASGVYKGGWEEGRKSGHGSFHDPDGGVYEGQWKDGHKSGKGTFKRPDGGIYTGQWKDSVYHGYGTDCYENGMVYEGQYEGGKYQGHGTCRYKGGMVYEGQWKGSQKHGYGTLKDPSAGTYEGVWRDDDFHGYGTYHYKDGGVYEGQWKDGHKSGDGTLQHNDGGVYTGQWKDSMYHGYGTGCYKDGAVYEGQYEGGEYHGHGTYRYRGGMVYEGQWKGSQKNGYGTLQDPSIGTYEGEWKDDAFHGYGTYHYKDGAVYRGEWRGTFHGHGTLTYPDGEDETGEWCNGTFQG